MFYAGHSQNQNLLNQFSSGQFNSIYHYLLLLLLLFPHQSSSTFTFTSNQLNYQHPSLSNFNEDNETEWERERERERELERARELELDSESGYQVRSTESNLEPKLNVLLSIADPSSASNHAGQVLGNTPQAGGFFSNPTIPSTTTTTTANTPINAPVPTVPNHIPPASTAPITTPIHNPITPTSSTNPITQVQPNPEPIPTSTSAIPPLRSQPLINNNPPESILPTNLGSTNPIPANTFVPNSQVHSSPSIEATHHHEDPNQTLLPTEAIIGIVVGLILIIILVPISCFYLHRKRQKSKKLKNHESFFNNPIITSTLVPNQQPLPSTQPEEYHFRGTPYPIGIEEHDYPKINHLDSNSTLNSPRRYDRSNRMSHHTSLSSFNNRFNHHDIHSNNKNGRIDEHLPIPLQVTDHSIQSPDLESRNETYFALDRTPYQSSITMNIHNRPIEEQCNPREEYHLPIAMESIHPSTQEELRNRDEYHLPISMEVNHHEDQEEEIVIEDFVPSSMKITMDTPLDDEDEEELDDRSSSFFGLGHQSFDSDETVRYQSRLNLKYPEEVMIRNGPQMDATFSHRVSSVQRIVSQIATTEQNYEESNPFKEPGSISDRYPSTLLQSSTGSDVITKKINQTLKEIQHPKPESQVPQEMPVAKEIPQPPKAIQAPKEASQETKEIQVPEETHQAFKGIHEPKERNLARGLESIPRNQPTSTTTTKLPKNRYLPRNLPKRNPLPIRTLNTKNLNQNSNQRLEVVTHQKDSKRLTNLTNESVDVPDPFVNNKIG